MAKRAFLTAYYDDKTGNITSIETGPTLPNESVHTISKLLADIHDVICDMNHEAQSTTFDGIVDEDDPTEMYLLDLGQLLRKEDDGTLYRKSHTLLHFDDEAHWQHVYDQFMKIFEKIGQRQ